MDTEKYMDTDFFLSEKREKQKCAYFTSHCSLKTEDTKMY